jgi:hypothetical protein|tara:strand:- start:197 stop:934 length:738 start_codon:yes stop_codon:yes gene_type:complete
MIIYEGPSLLDGQQIIVVATGTKAKSSNSKTGSMIQTWILLRDIDPREANKTGADYAICGECPHRGKATTALDKVLAVERTCYVILFQAPLNVWKTYHRGSYERAVDSEAIASVGSGRKVRLGSYGDPAAVPEYVWKALLSKSVGRTGYSHQSNLDGANFDPDIMMVSADNLTMAQGAWDKGHRTFRVIDSIASMTDKEVLCPASEEAGRRTNCESCGLCAGSSIKAKSIAIVAHGNGAKYAATN